MGNKERKIGFSAEKLKKALNNAGVTYSGLADEIGVNLNTISKAMWQQKIMPDILTRICTFLGINPASVSDDILTVSTFEDGSTLIITASEETKEKMRNKLKETIISFCISSGSVTKKDLESLSDEDFQVFQDHIIEARDKTIDWFFNEYLPGKEK